jgi:N6-L-threonylcarbamoyladenine synthase
MTLILGIETSCDETSAAVVENGERILSNIIASQIDLRAQYGVFPKSPPRPHQAITPVVQQALDAADVSLDSGRSHCGHARPGLADRCSSV